MTPARPRVLVVDTSADVMAALAELLTDRGYRCDLAEVRDLRLGNATPESLLGDEPVDLVIFDIAAPMDQNWKVLSSFEAHPRLRDVPFLLTTTNGREAQAVGHGRPAVELLLKPFDLELLSRLVDLACGRLRDDALWQKWFPGKPRPG